MSAVESLGQSTDALEAGGNLKDNMEEVEVFVRDAKRSKVTTIVQMVTTMIDVTIAFYQRLCDIKVDEQIKLVFKFVRSVAGLQEEGAVLEGVIEIICKHEHPYLAKDVWLATKTHMETTILKGTNVLFVVGRRTENQ